MKTILKSNQGVALVIVIMTMVLLLSITGAALLLSGLNLKTASSLKSTGAAFYIAETGLHVAIQELDDNDGTDDFASITLPQNPWSNFDDVAFGSGNYTVTLALESASPRIIAATSTGTVPNGASRVVKALLKSSTVAPDLAGTVNGDIDLASNIDIIGSCGTLHTNGNLTVSLNPTVGVQDGLTSSGTMTITGSPTIGTETLNEQALRDAYESSHDGHGTQALSAVNPADFAQLVADLGAGGNGYIFNDDGTVTQGGTCGTDGLCTGGTTVSAPAGWSWDGTRWDMAASTGGADGVFYAETPVLVSGNTGTSNDPWQSTIIARDSVEWTGNPFISPYPTSDTQLQDIYIVTGNDLTIAGNVGFEAPGGAILVHQQLSITSNPHVYGYVIAGNGSPTWTGDPFPNATSGDDLATTHVIASSGYISFGCDLNCVNPACTVPGVVMTGWVE